MNYFFGAGDAEVVAIPGVDGGVRLDVLDSC